MSKIDDIVKQLSQYGDKAGVLAQQLVDEYEDEAEEMANHLSDAYDQLVLLYDIDDDVAGSIEADAMADLAVDRIAALLKAEAGEVLLSDGAQHFTPLGNHTVRTELADLFEWATQQAIDQERAMIINDTSTIPAHEGVHSLLICPLRARGRVTGALHLCNKLGGQGFTTEDQKLLQAVATQIGSVLENARLYETEQRHASQLSSALDELESTYGETLAALSGALDLRDNETEGHSHRVKHYSVRIAQVMGLSGQALTDIDRGALLHDIGKIGVPDRILLKPGKLTDEEWVIMRRHPVLGFNMVKSIRFLEGASPIILHHHERFEGNGYPDKMVGKDIPLGARIFAVADTYDAITSDRPYRKAKTYEESLEEINRCSGKQFDPLAVEAFCSVPREDWEAIRARVEDEVIRHGRTDRRIEDHVS